MINTVEKKYSEDNLSFCYQVTYYQAIQEWIKEGGTVIDNGENN
jgi:hypothetical protein